MIKLADFDRLPIVEVMALQAIGTKPVLVRVLMAGYAAWRNAQEGAIQILDLDVRDLFWIDMLCRMAFATGQAGMLAFERITSLLMIESLGVPFNQGKIYAIVLGVADDAFLA